MQKLSPLILLLLFGHALFAQPEAVSRKLFFLDETVIETTLTTDIKNLRGAKKVPTWQAANISMKFNDTLSIQEPVKVQTRGEFRKTYCDIASLMLDFKAPNSRLAKLKRMKLVGGCRSTKYDEELLLKEYLVYKMYNHLSIMSFNVRLLHVNYRDSKQKVKPYSQYAFLIEDVDDVAERNNCIEKNHGVYKTEHTNRRQITLVSIFQYMIGNTDFSIPNKHNVRLIVPKNDTMELPYPLPYDFDYAGIVNAPYAVPREELGIATVRDRLYRGFGRTLEEIEPLVALFMEKKESIYLTIRNFPLLKDKTKEEMLAYLDDFYKTISNKRLVRQIFVENARQF